MRILKNIIALICSILYLYGGAYILGELMRTTDWYYLPTLLLIILGIIPITTLFFAIANSEYL